MSRLGFEGCVPSSTEGIEGALRLAGLDYGGGAIYALGRPVGVDIFGLKERAVESLWSRALTFSGSISLTLSQGKGVR